MCEVCDNKQLCRDCDDKWHQHPRRQNHQRRNMNGDVEEHHVMSQKPRLSCQGETPVAASVQGSSTQVGGGESYMTVNYGSPQAQPQNMGKLATGNLSNQMQHLGIESFNRPRTYSSSESMAGGDMSHMVEPQSVQTG